MEDTKGQSEYVYRRTDNTMAQRKSTKGQTMIKKHIDKTKNRVTRTPLNPGVKTAIKAYYKAVLIL